MKIIVPTVGGKSSVNHSGRRSRADRKSGAPGWTFLTNHAHVLLCIARNNQVTAKEIAQVVGITERAVQRIVKDLEDGRYISRTREGRRNRYRINLRARLRHPAQREHSVGALLDLLSDDEVKP